MATSAIQIPAISDRVRRIPDAETRVLAGVFIDRTISMLLRLVDKAPPEVFRSALAASSDVETLAIFLSAVAPSVDSRSLDHPLADALIRGVFIKEELLKEAGGSLNTLEVARLLGRSAEEVDRMRERGELLAVPIGDDHHYPRCLISEGSVLPGLAEFLRAFEVPEPWTQLSVLLGPAPSLDGKSALEALRDGNVEGAVSVARSFGEQGA